MVGNPLAAFQWLTLFNFSPQDSAGPTCVWPMTAYQKFGFSAFTPLVFLGELILTGVIQWIYISCKNRGGKSLVPRFNRKPFIRTSMALFLFSYSQITTVVLRYLQCVQVGPYNVVYSAPALDCDSSTYKAWLIVAVLLLIIDVVGAPFIILYFLYKNRDRIVKGEDKMQHQDRLDGVADSESGAVTPRANSDEGSADVPSPRGETSSSVAFGSDIGKSDVEEPEPIGKEQHKRRTTLWKMSDYIDFAQIYGILFQVLHSSDYSCD
jgi:hypothetical protein